MTRGGQKRKILFVGHDTGNDDSLMSLYWILKELDRTQYEAVVTIHQEGPLMDMVESLGWRVIKLHRIRLAKHERPPLEGLGERLTWWLWKKTRGEKVVQLIEKENIDLVHTNSMICFEGAYASHKTNRPHVWHIREILPGNRKLFGVFGTRKTLKMIARHSDKVVCISDAVKRQFTGWQRNPEKYITIYNGIDTAVFDPATVSIPHNSLRQQLNIPETAPVLGYAASISSQKGFSDLVDACVLLRQEGHAFHVVVAGESNDPRYLRQTQAMIAQCGLQEQIHFLGSIPQEEMPGFYKQLDIFVSPAHDEPFARSILEAMAMEVPVVATNTGGAPEAVFPLRTGLIAKTGVPGSLAKALTKLLTNPEQRRHMGQAGRSRVLSHFTVQHYVDSLHGLYRQILG